MKLLFLDTETTGLKNPRLVQLAYQAEGEDAVCQLYNPGINIELGAMAVHHITNEKIKDAPRFSEDSHYVKIERMLADGYVLVAHNAQFDIGVLKNEGIHVPQYICTYKVAQTFLTQAEQHKLQYLRYYLGINLEASAHSADGDVAVLKEVFLKLLPMVDPNGEIALEEMLRISGNPVKIDKFQFGKYKGKTFKEVFEVDRGYLVWLQSAELQKGLHEQNLSLLFTINHYLK